MSEELEQQLVELIVCKRCSQSKIPHKDNRHLCDDCVKAEDNRVSYYRMHNFNWMDVAKEADLKVWERQPAETDREWQVWLSYRDAYPSVRPSYRLVAETLGTSYNVVKKVAMRWTFPARLQAWAKFCDDLTLSQRRQEILDMNAKHISMATTLNDKLKIAIDKIVPETLEVKDIQGLFKLATDIERKARVDNLTAESTKLSDEANPELKKSPTKSEDLGTVMQILAKAGVLGSGAKVGVKQTTSTTTEIVVQED